MDKEGNDLSPKTWKVTHNNFKFELQDNAANFLITDFNRTLTFHVSKME